jgi:hypothetical protein
VTLIGIKLFRNDMIRESVQLSAAVSGSGSQSQSAGDIDRAIDPDSDPDPDSVAGVRPP